MPSDFLDEIALRSLYTLALVFLFLKMTGGRDVRQTSLSEVSIVPILGSAARDVAFYDGVSTVPVLIISITLASLYRLIMWLIAHSEKLEYLLEGRSVVTIEDGELAWSELNSSNTTEFEFSMELRLRGVEQLEQVRLAILETNRQISAYFFGDDKMGPGLFILSSDCTQRYEVVPESVDYACTRCSEIIYMNVGEKRSCPCCTDPEWAEVSQAKRMT